MIKIKSVLTALGNIEQYQELKNSNINIITNDIQYKEGILEYLNESIDINYLILNEILPGQISIKELIEKIKEKNKRIKIILISQQNIDTVRVYKKINQYNIFEIISAINEEDPYIKQYVAQNIEEEREGKILTILGANGIGKSIFAVNFAQSIKEKKVLIIDFNLISSNLYILLGIKKFQRKIKKVEENKYRKPQEKDYFTNNVVDYNLTNTSETEYNIINNIIQTKYKIDFISGTNLVEDIMKYKEINFIIESIKNIKEQYDLIIIDTSSNYLLESVKDLIDISNKSIFISGANVLEIRKAKELLEIYEEWGIEKEKINILFNKCTKESVDDEILKNIFKEYNIVGKINLNEYYDKAINTNNIRIKEIQKELNQIRKNIEEEKRRIYGTKQYFAK